MTQASRRRTQPLVYSCSGCSSAAQMANAIAIRMDRHGVAEMSCIAGVGGGVKSLVRVAKSGRQIVALDGCVLKCVVACLARHDLQPTAHFVLSDYDVEKRVHADFDATEAAAVHERIMVELRASGLVETTEDDEAGES